MPLMKTLILAALVLLLSTRAAARARDRNRPNRNAACEGRPPDASTLDVEIARLRDLWIASLQARSRNVLRRKPCFG